MKRFACLAILLSLTVPVLAQATDCSQTTTPNACSLYMESGDLLERISGVYAMVTDEGQKENLQKAAAYLDGLQRFAALQHGPHAESDCAAFLKTLRANQPDLEKLMNILPPVPSGSDTTFHDAVVITTQ